MLYLEETLKLDRCPHCSVDNPNLANLTSTINTAADNGTNKRFWRVYYCLRCGGLVTASGNPSNNSVKEIFPNPPSVNSILPDRVKAYLQQAIDSVFAPAGCVMLCASSVDAMLKEKGLIEGKLYARIKKAVVEGIITNDMSIWAHQVRLEANEQRHSDIESVMPTTEDAKQCIEFAQTLAELLFVLPSKVKEGIDSSKPIIS